MPYIQTETIAGLLPAGSDPNMIRTGHLEYNTLWASNEVKVINYPFIGIYDE